MGVQEILVIFLFAIALFYMGRVIYKSFNAKKGCGSSCKCGVDFSDVNIPDQHS